MGGREGILYELSHSVKIQLLSCGHWMDFVGGIWNWNRCPWVRVNWREYDIAFGCCRVLIVGYLAFKNP